MLPHRVQVVCLAVGDAPDEYVVKLESMLRRHMPVPFDLACVTDRTRPFPASITQIDAGGWPPPRPGMRPTTYKLSLFDRSRMPYDEFLYLDTTLVVQRDLTPLLEFAAGRPEDLVAWEDPKYDAYNTCVMRIRPGGRLEGIVRAYEDGEPFDRLNRGDQDFATGVIRARGWESDVATWPEGMVVAYKTAREMAKWSLRTAYRTIEGATVVKFSGEPKMTQLLDPAYRRRQLVEKRWPLHPNGWFWARQLRKRWR